MTNIRGLSTEGCRWRRLGICSPEVHRGVLRLCEGDAGKICQDRGNPLQFHQQVPGGVQVGLAQGTGRGELIPQTLPPKSSTFVSKNPTVLGHELGKGSQL